MTSGNGRSNSSSSRSSEVSPSRVDIADIKAKLEQIRGEADTKVESARSKLVAVGSGAALAAVIVSFWLGKRRGTRKATWVEVRRL